MIPAPTGDPTELRLYKPGSVEEADAAGATEVLSCRGGQPVAANLLFPAQHAFSDLNCFFLTYSGSF